MTRSKRRQSNGKHCNVNPCNFGLVVNRFRNPVNRKGKVMNQTVDFVNASDFFDAIELGSAESGEFLEQFTYGDSLTDFTLIARTTFLQRLTKFIGDCEDIYEKDVMMQSLKEFTFGLLGGIKHVNIEG